MSFTTSAQALASSPAGKLNDAIFVLSFIIVVDGTTRWIDFCWACLMLLKMLHINIFSISKYSHLANASVFGSRCCVLFLLNSGSIETRFRVDLFKRKKDETRNDERNYTKDKRKAKNFLRIHKTYSNIR